jgi:hypothetical protein
MAEDFQRREIELEIHAAPVPRGSTAKLPELLIKWRHWNVRFGP